MRGSETYLPTHDQRRAKVKQAVYPPTDSQVLTLLRQYRHNETNRMYSTREIATACDVTESVIRWLLAGHTPKGKAFKGNSPPRKGEASLRVRLAAVLGIPPGAFARARTQDADAALDRDLEILERLAQRVPARQSS